LKLPHPDYCYDLKIKGQIYNWIFKIIDSMSISPVRICTLPGLSDFRLERGFINRYPGLLAVDCCEVDAGRFREMTQFKRRPKKINLINQYVEDFLGGHETTYDFLFLDYIGGPKTVGCDIHQLVADRLTEGGLVAMTVFNGRRCLRDLQHKDLHPVSEPLFYNHMKFMLFRKGIVQNNLIVLSVDSHKSVSSVAVKPKVIEVRDQHGELANQLSALYEKWGSCLPISETAMIKMYLKGRTQKVIAKRLGRTQGAISARFQKAIKRMEFAAKVPTGLDVKMLERTFDKIDVDVFSFMTKTTCETEAAKLMTEKYNRPFNQITTRYRWKNVLRGLQEVCKLPDCSHLKPFLNWGLMTDSNLYMLHEVKFPEGHNEQCGKRAA
jgi:hypothetical protein